MHNESEPAAEPANPRPIKDDPAARAEVCYQEVVEVLRRHRCRVQAILTPEQVGQTGPASRMLLSASWGVWPDA